MYILHIETSTGICSVALSRDRILLSSKDFKEGMNHTSILAPAVSQILRDHSIKPKDLDAISISSGPGSYTGLRVGSSTAKAMTYSLGIPLIAVPTLTALAGALLERHPEAEFALPMIDARRKEVYTALFDRTMAEIWPVSSVILNEEFFSKRVNGFGYIYSGGDGAHKIGEMASISPNLKLDPDLLCSARYLVAPALELLAYGKVQDPLRFVPYYLKPPNITQPKRAGFGQGN